MKNFTKFLLKCIYISLLFICFGCALAPLYFSSSVSQSTIVLKYGANVKIIKGFYIGCKGILLNKEGARYTVEIISHLKTGWRKKTIYVTKKQIEIIE